jgi:alkylation response protein AidB-like acyl-CoA dehydrogenase
MSKLDFPSLLQQLRDSSAELQHAEAWPDSQLHAMSEAGVLGWLVPEEYGGTDISQSDLVQGYMDLASACLPSTFVLTQRNAAIQRIVRSQSESLKKELLPNLVTDESFTTVGISHLTTSRQHWKQPTVQVEQLDSGFIFNGDIPWVTGADRADYIVSGGTLENGKQLLMVIDTASTGVSIDPPVELMALNATRTASIRLNQVFVPDTDLLFQPVEEVMKQTGAGAGSYTTSALALGHAQGALREFREEAKKRPDLESVADSFDRAIEAAVADLKLAVLGESRIDSEVSSVEVMRQRCNSLAMRSTQAYLAASKGAGFVATHRAAQLVQEALFFLVWSCPAAVVMGNMLELAGSCETEKFAN